VTKRAATTSDAAEAAPARRSQPIDEILQLESFFSSRVSILAKLLDRRLARLVGDQFGLALAEYRVLAQITMRPRSTVRAVAARTFVDKAQVSRAVAVLEEQGLIARTMSGTDRRSPEFTATRSGRTLMNRIIPLRQAQERELAQHLGRGDLNAITGSFQVLIDRLAESANDHESEPTATQRRDAIRDERIRRAHPTA
jgi:DNA-binding MarR family transcriptional regulator